MQNATVELSPLNVLAGPNGSGKTNLLKSFDFLGDVAANDLGPAIERFGGVDGILFQNSETASFSISIEGIITKLAHSNALDEYSLSVKAFVSNSRRDQSRRELFFRRENFKFKRLEGPGRRITLSGDDVQIYDRSSRKEISRSEIDDTASGLAVLRKLGETYEASQVEEIAQLFLSLRLVDIDVRRVRRPVRSDLDVFLRPNGSNIAPFLLRLVEEHPAAFQEIEDDMRHVLPTFERFEIHKSGGGDEYVTIFVKELPFNDPIPLDRVSFGTIRAIVLFAMLNDPNPPRLTCIEEIDHGFHPQALDRLIFRLREATERTQIILATHSPALVNRVDANELIIFSRNGESGATMVKKPDIDFVRAAREEYGYELGELWFAGLLEDLE